MRDDTHVNRARDRELSRPKWREEIEEVLSRYPRATELLQNLPDRTVYALDVVVEILLSSSIRHADHER